ncbi:MAG: Fic family protein [Candidatus Diapherotrites archaeon]
MAVVKRKVKGKYYYYLEKPVRIGKRIKGFSIYLGREKPPAKELAKSEKKLEKRIKKYYRQELVKPGTKFINVAAAKSLERIKQETAEFLASLSAKQKEEWLEREREKFIANTNAIEGSTLTLDETQRIMRLNETIGSDRERLEVLNMEKCLERHDKYLKAGRKLDEVMVLQLHLILLNKIPDYDKYKGIWRPVNVEIRTSEFEFPEKEAVPGLIKKMFAEYEKEKDRVHVIELAAKIHCRLTTIHPFADGNGRIARLLLNYILQANGFPFTNIPAKKRDEYFKTQEQGHYGKYEAFTKFLAAQINENYRQLRKRKKNRHA